MNRLMIIGRLTEKPTLRYTNSNIPVTKITVAVNRSFVREDGTREVDFININVWRKQAENVCNYLDKGSRVAVEGNLQMNSYVDKDGNKRNLIEVVAESVEFLDTKPKTETTQTQKPQQERESDPFTSFGEEIRIEEQQDLDDNFLE